MNDVSAVEHLLHLLEKIPPGIVGLFIAACIACIWIGQSLRRDKAESRLVEQLQASLAASNDAIAAANIAAAAERLRADSVQQQLLALAQQSSRASALLEQVGERLAQEIHSKGQLEAKVDQLEATIEQLAQEIRNKDRSISELVRLNRQLLSSLPLAPADRRTAPRLTQD